MITKELLDYMRAEKAKGTADEAVNQALRGQGWAEGDISQAREALAPKPAAPVIVPVQPTFQTPPVQAPIQAAVQSPVHAMPTGAMDQFNQQPAPHGKKKLWIAIVIIVAILLAAAGTAYAYYAGYIVSFGTISTQSILAVHDAKGATFDVTVTSDTPSASDASGAASPLPIDLSKITLRAQGAYDLSDPSGAKASGTITANAGTEGAAAEVRLSSQTLYGQITEMPSFAALLGMSDQLNQWYSFDFSTDTPSLANTLPAATSVIGDATSLGSLTPDQQAHIASMTASAHFITVTKHMLPVKIGGVLAYHFAFTLDKAGMEQYATALSAYLQSSGIHDPSLSSITAASIAASLDPIKNFTGEAWIGVNDHLPYKLDLSFQKGTDASSLSTIHIVALLSGWNAPLTVDAPTGAVSISDMLAANQIRAEDAKTQAEISGLPADAALYSTNSQTYKGFCASDQAAQDTNGLTGVVCHDAASYFVAYAPLSDGTFACSDSKGTTTTTSASSTTGSICKNIVTTAITSSASTSGD